MLFLASVAHAQRDEQRIGRLKTEIATLETVVNGTKSANEKGRLQEKLERLQRELQILEQRQILDKRQRALMFEQIAGTVDMLHERLRVTDVSVEESEGRARELIARRKQVAADRDAVATQVQAEQAKAAPNNDRLAELEERLFTRNEELRAIAMEREAVEGEIELAREADRIREWLKNAATNGSQVGLRPLFVAYAQLRVRRNANDLAGQIINYDAKAKFFQNSLELSQQKLAKFDEELILLERQTGVFGRDQAIVQLLAQQRSQKNALLERLPFLSRQVEAIKRLQQARGSRAELARLATQAEEEHFDRLLSAYLSRLRWPIGIVLGIGLLYFVITHLLLPFRFRNEGLIVARRLTLYVMVLLAICVVAVFSFDDLSMVAATFGLVSAGIVIALQDVCTSAFGWFVIMTGGKVRIGDRLEVEGVRGDVIDVQLLRTTMVEINGWLGTDQPTGRVIVIPNNFIFKTKVYNFTHGHPFIWGKIELTVTYSTPIASAQTLFQRILEEETREEFEAARVAAATMQKRYGVEDADYRPKIHLQIADSGVMLTLFYVSHYRRNSATRNRINRRIIGEMESHPHIQFAYNTLHVLQDKPSSGPTAILGEDQTSPPFVRGAVTAPRTPV